MMYDRFGSTELSMAGLLLTAIFGPLLAVVGSHSTGLVVALVIFLVAIGVGISLVMTPQMAEIGIFADKTAESNPDAFGPRGATAQCCALMTLSTALAGVVGPIVLGAIQSNSGWLPTTITVGAFSVLGLITFVCRLCYKRYMKPHAETVQEHPLETMAHVEQEEQSAG
jgi:MFS family permease